MKDLFGTAILDYQTNNSPEAIITETTISDADAMEVSYLFRSFNEMPKLEQKALQLAKGRILDVGCGAGSHSLYLEEKGLEVTAIDISENAIKACRLRGLTTTRVENVLDLTGAGDLFASGFLKEYLDQSDIKKCLQMGSKLAAQIIQKIGARLN